MNSLSIQKLSFQLLDSSIILGAILSQFAIRRSERLWAILQDQARQDLMIARDRLMFDARNFIAAASQEFEYIVDDLTVDARQIVAALLVLPSIFYMIQQLDHEIPVYLEADLKPMGLTKPQLTAPAIAGLLPPASSEVVEISTQPAVQPQPGVSEIPAAEVAFEGQTSSPTASAYSAPLAFETPLVQHLELPVDWNRDRNGRKLTGAALQMRMKKYSLA